jgi:pyruvate dehydrogenase E2 component (dihydrolipoamide acetyltransferase)
MEVGKLVSWRVQEGDSVQPQDVLAEVETDKATMELETFDPGVVLKILTPAGSDIPVGAPIAIIGKSKDEDISELLANLDSVGEPAPSDDAPESTSDESKEEDARQKAGPAARKAATELGVDLQNLKGTGPRGRVLRGDVENSIGGGITQYKWRGNSIHPSIMEPFLQFVPNKAYPNRRGNKSTSAAEEESRIIPNSGMRKTIARRLKESYLDAPTFFLNAKFDCNKLVSFRSQLKEAGVKVSYNDILIKAVARALKEVPAVNASWGKEAITEHAQVDIGIAVALPEGLITPVLRNADKRGLADVASTTRGLIEKAKKQKANTRRVSKLNIHNFKSGNDGYRTLYSDHQPTKCWDTGCGLTTTGTSCRRWKPFGGMENESDHDM